MYHGEPEVEIPTRATIQLRIPMMKAGLTSLMMSGSSIQPIRIIIPNMVAAVAGVAPVMMPVPRAASPHIPEPTFAAMAPA